MKLEGKVAIITGSSRGIGACIARRHGAEGARVAVVAHSNLDKAEAVAKEIADAGGEAKAFQADVAQVSECDRLAGEVIEKAFTGTASRVEGVGFAVLAEEMQKKHAFGFPARDVTALNVLPNPGDFH